MRTSHHHQDTRSAQRVRHAVGFGGHAGHRPDPHQADLIFPHVIDELPLVHLAGIAIEKEYLVFGRGQRLQQEHPQVRHEIVRDFVIRVIK